MDSKRDQKRESAKKRREYSVYSKKAVRAKEAQLQKTCAVPAKTQNPKSH
jgi:hypothetical protein